jgi:hypothetical protein
MWWSNNEQRRQQKEAIKSIIRRTKLSEKTQAQMASMGGDSPPDLSYSLPTSDTFSDTVDRTRSVSVDSQYSLGYDVGFGAQQIDPSTFYHPSYDAYPPYEVDVKTERQMFVDDVPTRRDSSISTFSTFQPPPPPQSNIALPPYQGDLWSQEALYDLPNPLKHGRADELEFNLFETIAQAAPTTVQQAVIDVDECDRPLLDHFVEHVLRLIFPVLEVSQQGSARTQVILPALETNKTYLHCCLSISAQHLKSTSVIKDDRFDNDIMRHRYATISELCEALNRDTDHGQILEATLGMIFFQCSVGRADDSLPDIPWDQHFHAATSLVNKLELNVQHPAEVAAPPPFSMTLASWIDILGATMLGRAPQFADTYREKNIGSISSGLAELMGCDDHVMYLISEIACLEALKLDGMDDMVLCNHIHSLANQIGLTEPRPSTVAHPYSSTGAIRPRQLSENMTAVFRLAARIYLCSLVPGFDRTQDSIVDLIDKLAASLEYIPSGPDGFDRSLVWPLLIGGSVALPNSSLRQVFHSRIERLGEHAAFGSFGRVVRLLKEVWRQADEGGQNVHWRDVMRQNDWHFLLI